MIGIARAWELHSMIYPMMMTLVGVLMLMSAIVLCAVRERCGACSELDEDTEHDRCC